MSYTEDNEHSRLDRLKAFSKYGSVPEWHVQAAEWLDGEAPRPRVTRRAMFEFLVDVFLADDCPPSHAIECLENAGMPQDEIDRFKKYWLNKGLREGWLSTIALELALGSWSTEKMVRRSIKPYHRTLPSKPVPEEEDPEHTITVGKFTARDLKPGPYSRLQIIKMKRDGQEWSAVEDWITRQVGYDREVIAWAREVYNDAGEVPSSEEQLLEVLGLDKLTEEQGRYLSRIINRPIPMERKRELFRKKFPNQKWLH